MSLGKRLIKVGLPACLTETTDIFGDSSGVALYSLDYDASDASGDYDGTPTDVDFGVGGQANYGARFNGSSSNISIPALPITTSDDVTFSAWVKGSSDATDATIVSTLGENGLEFRVQNSAVRAVYRKGSSWYGSSTVSVTADAWNHVVLTYEQGVGFNIYVNNNTPTTYAETGTLSILGSSNTIGKYANGSSGYFDGDIDQVRIFSKALNSTEVGALYAETACVYDSTTDIVDFPNLKTNKAYIPFDNSAEDLVSGDFGTIASGMDFKFGRYGQAIRTTANAHFVNFPNISESPNSPFSYSCWANITDINQRVYLFNWATATGSTSAWGGILNGGGGKPYFNFCNNAATASTFTVPQKQWFHYVATYDGTTAKAYVDNQLVLTANISTNNLGTNNLRILDTITDTEAMIDQVRVYDSALDTDDIDKLYNEKPETDTSNFKTVLYEGTSSKQYISNVGYNLDVDNGGDGGFVWVKARTGTARDSRNYDTVRGIYPIYSSRTLAEGVVFPIEYDANGFFFNGNEGGVNETGVDYVAWVWKGGGDDVLNEEGTIDSQVSANTEAGFSIVKYTAGGTATVGHGLDNPPELIITKNLDISEQWFVYAEPVGTQKFLGLNTTSAAISNSGVYTSITDSTFTNNISSTSRTYINYCFHSVAGYSRIGSYTGNGSAAGPTVVTGFRPAFIMVKNTTTGNNWHRWYIFDNKRDTTNPNTQNLAANVSNGEPVNGDANINFLSNGFQISTPNNSLAINQSGNTFIFMAIA